MESWPLIYIHTDVRTHVRTHSHARTHTHAHTHKHTHTHTHSLSLSLSHTHTRCGRAEEELRACQAARDKALEELETIRLDPDFYFAGLTSFTPVNCQYQRHCLYGSGGASARGMGETAVEEGGEAEEEEVDFDSAGEGSASEEVDFDALPPAPRPPVRVQA